MTLDKSLTELMPNKRKSTVDAKGLVGDRKENNVAQVEVPDDNRKDKSSGRKRKTLSMQ